MFAWMNAEALALTLETRVGHFWSRSRGQALEEGRGKRQPALSVSELRTDCDQDAVVAARWRWKGNGVACHTGERSCFYRSLAPPSAPAATSACAARLILFTSVLSRRRRAAICLPRSTQGRRSLIPAVGLT